MAIDPSIPLQGREPQMQSPLALLSQVGQLQAQQQQSQQRDLEMQGQNTQNSLNQLTLQAQQRTAQDSTDQRAALAAATDPNTGQVDRLKLISTLAKLNPTAAAQTAQGLRTQDTAAQEAQAKLQDAQVQAATAHLQLKDKLLQGVTDQATYTNARNIAIQNGINPQEMPSQYDPQFVAQAHAQTMSQQQALETHLAQQKQTDVEAGQTETARHNKADETNTATATAQTGRYQQGELANKAAELRIERQKVALQMGNPTAAAQLLVDGDATLSELKARGSTPEYIAQTLSEAKRLSGGKYNAQSAESQFSVAKSPTNVGFFGSAKSLTDKGGTLDQLAAAAQDIPAHQLPVFNTITDAEKAATGNGPVAKYASILLGVSDDYSKVMGGGQGSDTSRTQALKLVPANASPEARAAAIEGIRGAVGSQINSRIGNNSVLKRMYGSDGGASSGMVTVQIPGHPSGQIPASALAKFKSDHPNATVQQ